MSLEYVFSIVSQIQPHLIQPRLVRHLCECSPDDKDFRALAPDLKLVEPEHEDQDKLDLLLLVADVVGDILNKEEDGGPEENGERIIKARIKLGFFSSYLGLL